LRITAQDCLKHGITDQVIAEPAGGAHRDHQATAEALDQVLNEHLESLVCLSAKEVVQDRYDRFRRLGAYEPA
jgi:acetyl-CoA carboxylase carboxyl transferase subunit alpha